jgi:hypothetical protein
MAGASPSADHMQPAPTNLTREASGEQRIAAASGLPADDLARLVDLVRSSVMADLRAELEGLPDAIATRLDQRARRGSVPQLVDAATVARWFGVSPAWVREHADELGVSRIGTGPRPRMRFDPDRVAAVIRQRAALSGSSGSQEPDRPVVERRAPRRRARSRGAKTQTVAIPAWEE